MERQVNRMIGYFNQMTLLDILAFGNILSVAEKDDFEEYLTDILFAFTKEKRAKRKQLLKLAKDVAAANRNIKEQEEEGA